MKEYFRNLSMRKSMALYGLIAALFITLMGIFGLFTMDRLKIGGNSYNDIIFSKELQVDVASPNLHIIDAFAMSMEYAYIKDPARREELRSKIDRAKELYDTSYAYWKEHLEDGSELYQLLIEESHKHVEAFFKVFYTKLDEEVQNENQVMVDAYVAVLIDRYNDHHDILEQAVTQVNEMADNVYSSSVKNSRNSVYLFVTLWAAMIIVGVILTKVLSNIIVTHATYVQSVVAEIANGNLTVEVDPKYETKDELGSLVTSVKAMSGQLLHYITYINEITSVLTLMADGHMQVSLANEYTGEFAKVKDALYKISTSLNSTLSSINDSAQRVAEGSNDVAESATTLSEGAADQASAIEELTASIIEISEKVDGNANSAEAAGTKITEVAEYMKECNGRMMELLHAMDDIYNSSHEIDQITKTMESIASQTNLLALNASIEAARAGESGKGFAVVAGEVGNLAAESADAAKHTAELIQATIDIVKKGTVLAKDTAEGLDGVVAGSDEIVSIMDTIVIGSKDQSLSLQQFSKGIEQISIVVDSNSETAMESASASDSLKEEAYHLKELVNQFELFDIK